MLLILLHILFDHSNFSWKLKENTNKKIHSSYLLHSIIFGQEPISFEILQRYILALTEDTNNWEFAFELPAREPTQTVQESSLFDTTSEEETASTTSTHSIAMAGNNM